MHDIVKKSDTWVARYEADPYAPFAKEGRPGIVASF